MERESLGARIAREWYATIPANRREPGSSAEPLMAGFIDRLLARTAAAPPREGCHACDGKGGYTDQMADGSEGLVPCSRCDGTGLEPVPPPPPPEEKR